MSIRLKPEIAAHISQTPGLRLKIQGAITASHNTMMKYLEENHIRLTELDALNIITEEMNLPLSDIIEGGKLSRLMIN